MNTLIKGYYSQTDVSEMIHDSMNQMYRELAGNAGATLMETKSELKGLQAATAGIERTEDKYAIASHFELVTRAEGRARAADKAYRQLAKLAGITNV